MGAEKTAAALSCELLLVCSVGVVIIIVSSARICGLA